jgi:hypothetical protein
VDGNLKDPLATNAESSMVLEESSDLITTVVNCTLKNLKTKVGEFENKDW